MRAGWVLLLLIELMVPGVGRADETVELNASITGQICYGEQCSELRSVFPEAVKLELKAATKNSDDLVAQWSVTKAVNAELTIVGSIQVSRTQKNGKPVYLVAFSVSDNLHPIPKLRTATFETWDQLPQGFLDAGWNQAPGLKYGFGLNFSRKEKEASKASLANS